jgi:CheY-like chemotaxis protein
MVHILVMSAEASNRAKYTSLLYHDGFHVEVVSSAEEGITLLMRDREPRVVLVDVTMPPNTLIGFLTILAVTPALRIVGVYAGVGELPVSLREETLQLMHDIGMHHIPVTADSVPLSREVARLALRLQAVS